MHHRLVLALVLFVTGTMEVSAQEFSGKAAEYCSLKKRSMTGLVAMEPASPGSPRHTFDVLDYKLDLNLYNCFITPYPKSYAGVETITFRVDSVLQFISLNAVTTSLTIDSVGLAGISFAHTSNVVTVNLDRTYTPGEVVQARIYFRHNNVTDQAFYSYQGMVFTDCEPEGARKWFPCWDKPSDKATLDLTAKVPRTVKFGSNGRLADSIQIADTIWYHWVSRDPIATYLMVMTGKVNYNLDIVYWHPPSHPSDSVAMRFYWNTGENVSNSKQTIIPMTTRYSELFGEHPFEKNGFATIAPGAGFVWGGMENQTLTSLCAGCWSDNLISHEFAHQWFGDMISPGTWADVWLNEGFATYCEALWYEYTGGYNAYKSDINGDASGYLSGNPGWPIYNPSWAVNTPDVNTMFNTAITYYKGACVLHMLRYTLGDSLFFAAVRAYATDTTNFRMKTAVTADFIAKLGAVTGQDLGWFFNQWVYSPNHPVYQNTYNITSLGGGVWMVGFRSTQTQTNTVFFSMPLEIRIAFASGPDTTVRVMNSVNGQAFAFTFGRQPASVQFDPNNNIVLKAASLSVGQTLGTPALVTPVNNAIKQPLNPLLIWNRDVSAAAYRLQLATDSSFSTPLVNDSTIIDTFRQVGPLQPSTIYYWRINAKNAGGTSAWSAKWSFTTSNPTDVPDARVVPGDFVLGQNYPNPFNPSTVISYGLPRMAPVRLTVYNTLGQQVALLVDAVQEAGYHRVVFDGAGLASGVYLYRLEAPGFLQARKLILMK